MWHCPHCGAPQAETARCWVCHKSSTTCSTCRHFRRAVSADIGYCALDRHRRPLTGLELRGCWEAAPATPGRVAPEDPERPAHRLRPASTWTWPEEDAAGIPLRGFVPVESLERPPARPPRSSAERQPTQPAGQAPALPSEPPERWADRTSLFGDLDP